MIPFPQALQIHSKGASALRKCEITRSPVRVHARRAWTSWASATISPTICSSWTIPRTRAGMTRASYPTAPSTLSPASSVLHYGTEVFEGLKAYRRPDGRVQLFRPWENVARLNRSCERLGLPAAEPGRRACRRSATLVTLDQRLGAALRRARPCTSAHSCSPIGREAGAARRAMTAMFVAIMYCRRAAISRQRPEAGENHGGDRRRARRPGRHGRSQMRRQLRRGQPGGRARRPRVSRRFCGWTRIHHKYVEEGGGMNVMFKLGGKVVTPMLTGSILRRHHPHVLSWN